VLLLAALLIAMPMAAWGTWSSQDTLQANASAGEVPPPSEITCKDERGGLLGLASHVRITWTAPPASPELDEYLIEAQTMSGEVIDTATVPASTREIGIGGGVLAELLGGLLDLLLGGEEQARLRVSAAHESGWQSPPTEFVEIKSTRLLWLLPLGVECA